MSERRGWDGGEEGNKWMHAATELWEGGNHFGGRSAATAGGAPGPVSASAEEGKEAPPSSSKGRGGAALLVSQEGQAKGTGKGRKR
jgi:hypothetical protein